MNDYPIVLRDEDRAAPDPQTAAIEHAEAVQVLCDEVDALVSLLTRWSHDPIGVLSRAQARTVELRGSATRVQQSAEALSLSRRVAGHYSTSYAGCGGSDGR